jgi:hypothetical protein
VALYRAGLPDAPADKPANRLFEDLRSILTPRTLAVLLPFLIWSMAHYGAIHIHCSHS